MATNATIVKIELQISDMDRHYYASHALTLAQHPSETPQRLMVRTLAFALHAHERLEFGPGLSSEGEEPEIALRDYTGDIELWIDVGQPDESRIRKACGRSRQVVVVNYGGNAADVWWDKNANALQRVDHLRDVPAVVRFLSCEPLIGPLDGINLEGIHWVIAGGESGPNYRPMDINWARGIRDACTDADVAFFFKQWGGRTPKALGRQLDGELWDEMPFSSAV